MADLFRKSSLEKLSSPEQLDKMIVITPPSFWLAMLGAALIVVSALVWSIFGRLPENVEVQGIYINNAGVQSVYCEGSGVVSELKAHDGDTVKKGDIIALLDTSDIDKKIAEYEEKKAAVENISTNTNVNAVKISSNKDIIAEYQSLYQSVVTLDYQTKQLTEKSAVLASTEQKYKEAETAYYNSLNTGDSTKEQMAYQEAQSTYSAALSDPNYAIAKAQLDAVKTQLDAANAALTNAKAEYEASKSVYETAKTAYEAAKAAFDAAQADYNAKLAAANNDITNPDVVASAAAKDAAESDKTAKETAVTTAESNAATAQAALTAAEAAVTTAQTAYDDAKTAYKPYQDAIDNYEKTKNDYLKKVESIGSAQAKQGEISNKYNVIAQQYSNEKSTVQNLEDSVDQTKLQIDAYKTNIISSLKSEYKQYLDQKEASEIKATADGKISDLAVSTGSIIGQGTEAAKIQMGDKSDRVVVCYVPVSDGRKVKPGMNVLIYPSTVNKQEYGHMEATVIKVDEYITSTTDMQQQLGDTNLVEAFMQNGPVVEVRCELKADPSTVSGYYWSSNKGASVNVDGGTMVEASVVISEKPPISLLIPFLKEKLTIKADN